MENKYLKFNYELISKSNFKVPTFDSTIVEKLVDRNGTMGWLTQIGLRLNCNMGGNKPIDIEKNPVYGLGLFFPLVDYYVDIKINNPDVENYRCKYKTLQCNNNIECVLKGLYRILKCLRNAVIHNVDKLDMDSMGINIDYVRSYKDRDTQFKLRIDNETLVYLWKAVCILLDENLEQDRGRLFKESILVWYYQKIRNVVGDSLEDDINDNIKDSPPINFDISAQYGIEGLTLKEVNPNRDISISPIIEDRENDVIYIKNTEHSLSTKRDFYIVCEEGCYLVPEEYLNEGCIARKEMLVWQVSNDYITP